MDSIKTARLDRLRYHCKRLLLVKEDGEPSPGKLGQRISRETNYCSDLLHGRRSFGEDIARHIEDALELARFDLDGGTAWPFEDAAQERFDRLTPRQKGRVEQAMLAVIEAIEADASGKRPPQAA